MRRRSVDDVLACLGDIEVSIAAVEQAITRLRLAWRAYPRTTSRASRLAGNAAGVPGVRPAATQATGNRAVGLETIRRH